MKTHSYLHLVIAFIFLTPCGAVLAGGGTIRVVDATTKKGIQSDIYHVDNNDQKHRAGKTDSKGVCILREAGKQGEKYVAISEQYNTGETECPVANAVIEVRPTTLLEEHRLKGEFLASAGNPGAAALEFRKASIIAEKNRDQTQFKQLEYMVAASVAKALKVEKPFVTIENTVMTSADLKTKVKAYQRGRDLQQTGALSRETLATMASSEKHEF